MATKKPAKTETEEQLLEQPAEEPAKENADAKLKAQQAEIEKLKAQLAKAQAAVPQAQNDYEAVKAVLKMAAESGVDPWSVTVNVRSPRRPGREDPWYWLSVNNQSVQLPADDRRYDLKLPWAECLMNSLEAERYAAEYQDKLEVYDPVTNPHRE